MQIYGCSVSRHAEHYGTRRNVARLRHGEETFPTYPGPLRECSQQGFTLPQLRLITSSWRVIIKYIKEMEAKAGLLDCQGLHCITV